MGYIPSEVEKQVKNFKYVACNFSYSYQYIWSPLAQHLLAYVPQTMAPNLITILGFLCVIIGHLIIMCFGEYGQKIENWRLTAFSVLLLIYQTLDNLDGKQARKTKSSSPLGMLFDHGSDSLSSFLIAISFLKILSITNKSIIIIVIFTHVLSVFYCAMWNQYHTHSFQLGKINPADDGIPIIALISILNCFIDNQAWKQPFLYFSLNVEVLIFLVMPLILLLLNMNKNILRLTKHSHKQTLTNLLNNILFMVTLLWIQFFGPNHFFDRNFYKFAYTLNFISSRNITLLQLAFITKEKFNVLNFPFLLFVFGNIGYCIYWQYTDNLILNDQQFSTLMLIIQAIFYFQFIVNVIFQLKSILGIKIFSIKKQSPASTKQY